MCVLISNRLNLPKRFQASDPDEPSPCYGDIPTHDKSARSTAPFLILAFAVTIRLLFRDFGSHR